MALSAGGIGSGLDVNSIVSQLMALERRPLDQLGEQKSDLNAKLSAYGQLKSAFSTFQSAMNGLSSADKFQVFSATSSNSNSFTATASSTASAAGHSIDVLALANAHKLSSGKDPVQLMRMPIRRLVLLEH
jgi:flagellar hook-associated protein 2